MARGKFRVWLCLVGAVSVVLRWFVPPNPKWFTPHDDLLMVRLADQIRAGNWLGDYDTLGNLTLAKPAGYPLFLAKTHFLPWPPTVTVHLMVLAGLAMICVELRRISAPRPLVLGLFAAGAFFPPFFGDQMSRIYRDSLLTGLTFLSVGIALHLASRLDQRNVRTRPLRRWSTRALVDVGGSTLALGACLSLYIATKPSWHAVVLVTVALVARPFAVAGWAALRRRVTTILAVAATLLVGLSSIVGYVVVQNSRHFGVARLDSFASGPFAEALNAWTSVSTVNPRPYVLVDSSQRRAVYDISPTARALRPHLEGAPNTGWRRISCESPMQVCDESGAWFPWELRDAVRLAGLDTSADAFDSTLSDLADEIGSACDTGRLRCGGSGLAPGILPVSRISPRVALDAVSLGVSSLLSGTTAGRPLEPESAPAREVVEVWNRNVRGLPQPDTGNVFRRNFLESRYTVGLLDDIYGLLWLPTVCVACLGFVVAGRRSRRLDGLRAVGLVAVAGIAVSLAQLALLEASSGLFMLDGRHDYLLPTHAFVMLFVGHGLLRLWDSPLAANRHRQSGAMSVQQ